MHDTFGNKSQQHGNSIHQRFRFHKALKIPKGPAFIIKGRSYCSFYEMSFANDLGLIVRNAECPGAAWTSFQETLGRIIAKHAPLKQFKIPNRSPDWFNDEYIVLRKQ